MGYYLLFLLCLVVLAWMKPRWATFVLLLLVPTFLVRFNIGSLPSNLLELSTYAIALGTLLKFATNLEFRVEVVKRLVWLWQKTRVLVWAVITFLGAGLLATIITIDFRRSLGVYKGWFIDPVLAALLIFISTKSKKDSRYLVFVWSVMAAVLSGYGIVEYINNQKLPWFVHIFRLDSIFESANYHALLVGPIILLGIGLLVNWREVIKHRVWSAILGLATLINLVALYFTYSFGGFLAISGGLVVLVIGIYVSRSWPKKLTYALILLAIIAVGVLFLDAIHTRKFKRDFTNLNGESSLRARTEVWRSAIVILEHYPVVGVGLGNFEPLYNKYVLEAVGHEPLQRHLIHAHNVYLDFWIDDGLLGLLSFLFLLGVIFYLTHRVVRFNWALAWAVRAGLVGIMLHGLVDTPYFKNDLSYLFWTLPTLLVVALYYEG